MSKMIQEKCERTDKVIAKAVTIALAVRTNPVSGGNVGWARVVVVVGFGGGAN